MATLAALVDGVYRDLADQEQEVFSTLEIEDFVRGGIADLNRVAPNDTVYELVLVTDPDTGVVTQMVYDIPIELPYRTTIRRDSDGYEQSVTEPVDGWQGSGGIDFKRTATGGRMEFPIWYLSQFDASSYTIRVHGYAPRPLPYTVDGDPSPEVGLSSEEEYSVRAYAKAAGFDLLAHNRSLFAQWQGQTNNSDVSPTQMMQMSGNAKQEWDRQRGLIRTVRKMW
jgi:hypothetical protein